MATSTDRAPSMDRFDAPAAALVVVLGGLYVLSLARSDSTILGHSFLFEAVIVRAAKTVAHTTHVPRGDPVHLRPARDLVVTAM